nr:hypothetical protein [Mangrovicoccus ximenensis]
MTTGRAPRHRARGARRDPRAADAEGRAAAAFQDGAFGKRDRPDQAVAAAADGFDELRIGGAVAEQLAQLADALFRSRLAAMAAAPDEAAQLVLADGFALALGQRHHDRQRLAAQPVGLAVADQLAAGNVEFDTGHCTSCLSLCRFRPAASAPPEPSRPGVLPMMTIIILKLTGAWL